jgi:hypothetical protein
VDQLESSTPGLVAQLKGRPTIKRYKAATVFVVFTCRSPQPLPMRQSRPRIASSDMRRRKASRSFTTMPTTTGSLTTSSVKQLQTGGRPSAERRIRELQDHARTMLIHARKRWPSAIDTHLLPYALRMANDALNSTPNIKQKQIPIEIFSGSKVSFNPKDCYHFGTPVYVLDNTCRPARRLTNGPRGPESASTWDYPHNIQGPLPWCCP